jgi:transglutaminase-like putative cysteine protease
MKLNVSHKTHYTYAQQVKRSTQYLRLTPQNSSHQKILTWELSLPEYATRTTDAYGNVLHVLTLSKPTAWSRLRTTPRTITSAIFPRWSFCAPAR